MPQGVLDDPSSLYKQEVPTLGTFVFHRPPHQRPIVVARVGPSRPCCAGSGGVGAWAVGSAGAPALAFWVGGRFSARGSVEAPGTEPVPLSTFSGNLP